MQAKYSTIRLQALGVFWHVVFMKPDGYFRLQALLLCYFKARVSSRKLNYNLQFFNKNLGGDPSAGSPTDTL